MGRILSKRVGLTQRAAAVLGVLLILGMNGSPLVARWEEAESWSGTTDAPAEWQPVESWTGSVENRVMENQALDNRMTGEIIDNQAVENQILAWSVVDSWRGMVKVPRSTASVKISHPSPWIWITESENFAVTWRATKVGISKFEYLVEVKNMRSYAVKENLEILFEHLSFDPSQLEVRLYELKVLDDQTPATKADWVPCGMRHPDVRNGAYKQRVGEIELPPLGSKTELDHWDRVIEGGGAKLFKLEFEAPFQARAGGWGSSGKVAFLINGEEYHPWWDSNWTRRRPITITGDHPENYQLKILITYDSDMMENFDDLRFLENEASGELAYWIENYNSGENAIVWVRRIENADTTIYMYYGNPYVSSASSGEDTFVFYDDFESGTLEKWTKVIDEVWSITTDQTRSGNYALKASAVNNTSKSIVATGVNEDNVAFDAWWRLSSVSSDFSQVVRASSETPLNDYEINWESSRWVLAKMINGDWYSLRTTTSNPLAADTWIKITTIIVGTQMKVLKDDSQLLPDTGWFDVGTELSSGSIGFRALAIPSENYWWIDDVKARKYVDPEPTTSIGAEESIIPVLYGPSSGASTDSTPTFEWTPAADVDNHRLVVDNSSSFDDGENAIDVLLGAKDNLYPVGWPYSLTKWNFRKKQSITGSSEDLTDYQLRMRVHRGSGTDNSTDVFCGGKCRDNFEDIR